jgi:3-oxoacyl-[acyl-carrier-protein] synthase II
MHEVVITGVGIVSPIGDSFDACAEALIAGRSAVRRDADVPGRPPRVSARVTEDLAAGHPAAQMRISDRTSLMAMKASDRALADAGLAPGAFDPLRTGTFLGSAAGPVESQMIGNESFFLKDSMSSMTVLRVLPNAPGSFVSMRHGLRGESATVFNGCASGSSAIGQALRAVRRGQLDVAIAGGVEAPLSENSVRMWEASGRLAAVDEDDAARVYRPFSNDRQGLVLGEGCALFILESAAHARARGATVYARLAGYGTSCDPAGVGDDDARGLLAAMQAALRDAGVDASEVGYVKTDGAGTARGDVTETRALKQLFGERARAVPASSTKPVHGHLLGASSALELVTALLPFRRGQLAPTINLDDPDPDCDLDYVPGTARPVGPIRAVLANSFALGGISDSLVLTRWEA